MAQDRRGGLSTPKAQADYLESQTREIGSGTIEAFQGETGHEVVVAADEAWEAEGGGQGRESKPLPLFLL